MNRHRKLVEDAARKRWGSGWTLLSPDMQEGAIAKEVLSLLLAQCEQSGRYAAAQELVRKAMGWQEMSL